MKKPVIAIVPKTGNNAEMEDSKFCYVLPRFLTAIHAAGGIPVMLNNMEGTFEESDLAEIISRVDGVLFSGGPDVDPKFFGEETMDCCGSIAVERDALEIPLMKVALASGKPVMGVCRGFQVLNVVLGGTLYQDINTQLKDQHPLEHRRNTKEEHFQHVHKVNVVSGTPLSEFAEGKAQIGVNSLHHQALKDVAEPLKKMGVSEDGIVEAVYLPESKFVMGFQWHPEYLRETDPVAQNIFKAFVKACAED